MAANNRRTGREAAFTLGTRPTLTYTAAMKKAFWKKIRNYLVIGLILVTPVAITAIIANYLFQFLVSNSLVRFLADQIARLLPSEPVASSVQIILIRAIAVLLMLSALVLIGFLVKSYMGKAVYRWGDRILGKIPIVNKIYLFVRQVSETLLTQRQSLFKEVVFIEYPRTGLYSIGFVTSPIPDDFRKHIAAPGIDDLVTLFVPTTPNPTSGFIVFARRSECRPFPGTTSDAMTLILSGGNIFPGTELTHPRKSMLDLLDGFGSTERARATNAEGVPPAAPTSACGPDSPGKRDLP